MQDFLHILSLLAGIDLVSGRIHYKVFEKHRSCEFIEYLKELESIHPEETRKYLETVPDKFEFVFTSKHASWLNIIEIFFSKMVRSLLRGMRVDSINELKEILSQYMDRVNEKPILFT